jgi:tetratricopeptide (TPR) repeat protein
MNWISTICREVGFRRAPKVVAAKAKSTATVKATAIATALMVALAGGGCRAVRGRKMIQDANELYRRGKYQDAVALFAEAEKLVPELPVLWLNKGYTCRQLVIPGARAADNRQAADCALAAFTRLKELRPDDLRAEQLYEQTLFDTDDLPALERLFSERSQKHPDDLDAVRGLQQVYYKAGKWPAALQWSRKAAALRPTDAEAQYGVGTFIWQVLSSRGGGAEMVSFDPRPRPVEPGEDETEAPAAHGKRSTKDAEPAMRTPAPPPTAANDITGPLRIELADEGIAYLEKALALHPRYGEAMTYLGLLQRQKSFAYFAQPDKWQAAVDQARAWQEKAAATKTVATGAGKP